MEAKFTFEGVGRGPTNAKNLSNEKEKVSSFVVVARVGDEWKQPVVARCYMGRSASSSVVYASIWVSGSDFYCSGRGQAGGYGYCKQSAAIDRAIDSAGIKLSQSIDGAGESKIREAMIAIAVSLGFKESDLYVVCE